MVLCIGFILAIAKLLPMLQKIQKNPKFYEALDGIYEKTSVDFKNFWVDYVANHPVPIPDDKEMWNKFIEYKSKEEKLHHA
jgi:hypothetical protein